MNDDSERMLGDMVIAGLSERTREAYARAVRRWRSDAGAYLKWMRVENSAARVSNPLVLAGSLR